MAKKSLYTREGMRERFKELTDARAEIMGKLEPLQTKRDAYVNETTDKIKEMDAEIRELRDPLFDIEQERGLLVKALGGKTSDPEEIEDEAEETVSTDE